MICSGFFVFFFGWIHNIHVFTMSARCNLQSEIQELKKRNEVLEEQGENYKPVYMPLNLSANVCSVRVIMWVI